MSGHRYRIPAEPLLALFDSKSDAARKLGLRRRSLIRWSQIGLPLHRADELAAAAGCHPLEVWGDGWDEAWDAREERMQRLRQEQNWRRRPKAEVRS